MKRNIETLTCFVIFLLSLIIAGCNNEVIVTSQDIDNISLEIVEHQENPRGINYTLRLHNKSKQVIKQNNVYLSFPIITGTGLKGNEFKIEARDNKLDIKPGEEVLLSVFAPEEMYEDNKNIDIESPIIEIKGYINEVIGVSQFHKTGDYRAMKDF
ncbi:hypothetical protein [Paenibacillus sp.]|uniref:hypothetical protein n=1 Tax=Paenibacillus sp. TaxID=58172 RepID=UPI002D440AAA|nr:hypothetical protein [Paenibacillus sp.]HZG84356.1 hypothetical protein [Paenibacillus sp.]